MENRDFHTSFKDVREMLDMWEKAGGRSDADLKHVRQTLDEMFGWFLNRKEKTKREEHEAKEAIADLAKESPVLALKVIHRLGGRSFF